MRHDNRKAEEMTRYRSHGGLDDPSIEDGDNGFIGFASGVSPESLAAGICSLAENCRFDKKVARCRKGIKLLSTAFELPGETIIIPTTLIPDVAVTSINRTSTTATVITATVHGFVDNQFIEISGASPTGYNGDKTTDYVDTSTFTYSISGSPATPATGTIKANGGKVLSSAYQNGVFASGIWYNPSGKFEYIVLACGSFAYLMSLSDVTTLVQVNYPAGETVAPADGATIIQCLNKLIIMRGSSKQPIEWAGDLSAAFTLMPSTGSVKWNIPRADWAVYYANRLIVPLQFIDIALTSITRSSATVTVTTSNDHGLVPGDTVTIGGCVETDYNAEWVILTCPSTKTFTFTTTATPGTPATGTPYLHYVTRDELIFSDILDINTYDPVAAQFRMNKGSADWLIGVYPWVSDQVLVFFRHSIWVISGASDPENATVQLITGEIGASSRKSLAGAGSVLFFLSGKNIYKIEYGSEQLLSWVNDPLSRGIDDIMARINEEYSENAVGMFYDNRYYIAVPVDDSTRNNVILVYNILNASWESYDTIPGDIRIDTFITGLWDNRRRLLATSFEGGVYLIEENTADQVAVTGDPSDYVDIPFKLLTRRYDFDAGGVKRIRGGEISTVLPAGCDGTIIPYIEDPDQTAEAIVVSSATETDPLLRFRISCFGRGAQLEIALQGGLPEVKSVRVEGYVDRRNFHNI